MTIRTTIVSIFLSIDSKLYRISYCYINYALFCPLDIYYLNDTDSKQLKRNLSWKRPNLSTPISESNQSYTRFRKPNDRVAHNAKERQCRNNIANMFRDLRQICSYFDCNRRIPSKHSILLSAKRECNLLKECEKTLLEKKRYWLESNALLKQKVLRLSKQFKN